MELLIVIVVIGILAAISIVAYNGIQDRARQTKTSSDLSLLKKASVMARENNSQTLAQASGSTGTAFNCTSKPDGTDLSTLHKSDSCWLDYYQFLNNISTASGVDIRGITDPWGRPYMIDENEGVAGACTRDLISVFTLPFQTDWYSHPEHPSQELDNSSFAGCA